MPDALARRRNTPWKKGQAVSFPQGANLLDETRHARRLYLLSAGQVRLMGANGVIFDHLKRGSFVGEKFLLPAVDGHAAIALSAVDAISFRESDLVNEWRCSLALPLRLVEE